MRCLTTIFLTLFTLSVFSQATLTLITEAKLRKTDSPLSKVLFIIPSGKQINTLSLKSGYYKVDYNGKIGYINEIYFQVPKIGNNIKSNSTTSNQMVWDEYNLKNHWKITNADLIEGIYEVTDPKPPKYKLGLLKAGDGYKLIYLSGATSTDNWIWKVGDTKAFLTPTATSHLYKAKWNMSNKTISENLYITFESGFMKIIWTDGNPQALYLKLYPIANENISPITNPSKLGSGTGFGISSNGVIATNFHVIDGAKTIKVRGINSDFTKTYIAKVLVSDKNNDLALIQIEDNVNTTLGIMPYTIKRSLSGVGENIFVLGYPLRATMGDEIKLTNGIISSKTGFQGDITSYQISAPVQPGNSGGPLFDNQGNHWNN